MKAHMCTFTGRLPCGTHKVPVRIAGNVPSYRRNLRIRRLTFTQSQDWKFCFHTQPAVPPPSYPSGEEPAPTPFSWFPWMGRQYGRCVSDSVSLLWLPCEGFASGEGRPQQLTPQRLETWDTIERRGSGYSLEAPGLVRQTLDFVSVFLGCHNKMQYSVWLKKQVFSSTVQEAGGPGYIRRCIFLWHLLALQVAAL